MTRKATLLPQHDRMLKESAIAPEVARARGYRSVETKAELKRLGFTDLQCRVPTLLIPIRGTTGGIATYQSRPDEPRIDKRRKPVKYETPRGTTMVLDIPLAAREHLGDPSIPLFITEGAKKVDAAASAGLCCIGVLGVWNWRGTNKHRGVTALADWESIALKNRKVYLAFDSDVVTKHQVYAALARLKAFLESRCASVLVIYLPFGEGGRKIGLDDFLATGHTVDDLLACASGELRPLPDDETSGILAEEGQYRERQGGLFLVKHADDDEYELNLTNFTARITSSVVRDDGVETQTALEIEATLRHRVERFTIPASRFNVMAWPIEHLGAGAIVSAGFGTRDHARVAIQALSGDVPRRRVYTHTGWTRRGGDYIYLHGGGAIGGIGPIPELEVDLPRELARYALPSPPAGEALTAAVLASLGLLDVAPDRVTVPLLGAVYRAPLGAADFSVHLAGPTGAGKTELAALGARHYGPGLDRLHLPSWSSTGNALEGLAFHAKDALLVVDDFAPSGNAYDVARLHRTADRFMRGQGNLSGRSRLAPDGSLRATHSPRGLTVSTGEDVPRGQSLRARLLVVELGQDETNWNRLTEAQSHAAAGRYAGSLSAFIQWIASRHDRVLRQARKMALLLRDLAHESRQHRRTASILGELGAGLRMFLGFAVRKGVIAAVERTTLWRRIWRALGDAADLHGGHVHAAEPTVRFLELLTSAIVSGEAHVAAPDGHQPSEPKGWGWRPQKLRTGLRMRDQWVEQGKRVGWLDGDDLYVDLDAALKAAQVAAGPAAEGITIGAKTLVKRLHEQGLLVTTDEERGHLKVRKTLEGKRRSVVHLLASALHGSVESAQSAHDTQCPDDSEPDRGPIIGPIFGGEEESTHGPAQEEPDNHEHCDANGTIGTVSAEHKQPISALLAHLASYGVTMTLDDADHPRFQIHEGADLDGVDEAVIEELHYRVGELVEFLRKPVGEMTDEELGSVGSPADRAGGSGP